MSPVELFIIYLSCGAPLGVYYFLKHRTGTDARLHRLKTFLVFLFWMPCALLLLRRQNSKLSFLNFGRTNSAAAEEEKEISLIQKEMEKIALESGLKISIYEFRETIERYAGLTLAARINGARISEHEREIFRVSEKNNTELGSICLNRRNRKRLFFHQSRARKDFLYLIGQLFDLSSGESKLESLSIEFVRLLKDAEAENDLEKLFADSQQTEKLSSVIKSEKDLWKPEKHKPLPSRPTSPHLQTMNRAVSLRRRG